MILPCSMKPLWSTASQSEMRRSFWGFKKLIRGKCKPKPPTKTVGGRIPLGPWQVSVFKLTWLQSISLVSKDNADLFLFCSCEGSLIVEGLNYWLNASIIPSEIVADLSPGKRRQCTVCLPPMHHSVQFKSLAQCVSYLDSSAFSFRRKDSQWR